MAEQAQTAKNLADPLRKIHKQTAAAVFKAKDFPGDYAGAIAALRANAKG